MAAFSFKRHAGMPSGPEALAGLRRVSFFRTLNSVTVGGLVWCTSPDASGCRGEKEFIGARNALLMVLERALRLESGPESKRFKTEVGSVRVADCIPPSLLTSFHHLRRAQSLRCSTLDSEYLRRQDLRKRLTRFRRRRKLASSPRANLV